LQSGKVRDRYFSDAYIYMVSSDRVSAFDCLLGNLIPFKGILLNKITTWAFMQTEDIVKNALVVTVDKEERAIGSTPEGAITKSNQKGTGGGDEGGGVAVAEKKEVQKRLTSGGSTAEFIFGRGGNNVCIS